MTGSEQGERTPDTILISELIGLLSAAEHYITAGDDARLHYLDKRASLFHRLVDATGDEASRYLAQDAEDRARDARAAAEAMAADAVIPGPRPAPCEAQRDWPWAVRRIKSVCVRGDAGGVPGNVRERQRHSYRALGHGRVRCWGRVPAPPGSGGEPGSRYPERAP
ncbi:hypothetical protein ABCR94_34335 [Streptomyces sp. 21So2-11]|uniref:hypothetical protein n=1 Tax=Streptomyces sp. 21So2-11 TaxID=3144408 RepID=UPI003219882F